MKAIGQKSINTLHEVGNGEYSNERLPSRETEITTPFNIYSMKL